MQSFADNWAARLRTPEWFRADPWQTIVSLSAGYLLAYSAIDTEQGDTIWRFIVLPVIAVAFALRFRQPEIAIAITLGATYLAMFVLDGSVLICFGLVELCLLSLGIQRPVQVAVLIAIIVTGFLYLPAKEISGVDWTVVPSSGVIISLITASGAAAGIGIAIRAQRNFIAAIQLQTLQAIVSRESEARRQVTEERLRIARDLHDAVAHHIAVVSVFIGLARTAPAQAEQALASAQESTRSVLAELQQILQLLRDNDSLVDPPSPGMDAIDDLLDSFSRIGLEVDAQINGSPAPVSTAVGLAIYRVLQESLTI